MQIPQTNYLKNTAPELEQQFVDVISKISLFAQLPDDLLHQLFQYSKFIKLKDQERVIEQGMFDQEIFVLIQGMMSVFLKDPSGNEEQVDLMNQPFTLFGERSLLGEPRGASIQAKGEVLLLGIDLSSLPDLIGATEDPGLRLDDENYTQNLDMYTVMSIVLTERLDRLIRDEYKLKQKVESFREVVPILRKDLLHSAVFNDFCAETLPSTPEVRSAIHQKLKNNGIPSAYMREHVLSRKVQTRRLYTDLARMSMLNEIENADKIIFAIVDELSEITQNYPQYAHLLEVEPYQIEDVSNLGTFFHNLHLQILESGMLVKPLSQSEFLNVLIEDNLLDPSSFSGNLKKGGWVEGTFSLAYIMYLVCQTGIYSVSEANQKIRQYVKILASFSNAPRQDLRNVDDRSTLTQQLVEMYKQQEQYPLEESAPPVAEEANSDISQDDIDALFGTMG